MQALFLLSKHLPPSAGPPRTLAVDAAAAALLAREGAEVDLVGPSRVAFAPAGLPFLLSVFDAAVVGEAGPALDATGLLRLLRPGGRLIALAAPADRVSLLDRLGRCGFVHLFAEEAHTGVLVRGERPPQAAAPVDRIAAVAAAASARPAEPGPLQVDPRVTDPAGLARYLHLLIAQAPNKPAWRLQPGDRIEWRAAVAAAPNGRPAAPVFTSLIKAVAFMQAAVLAGALHGVNKVGKFPAPAARRWPFLLVVDPSFEHWQAGLPAGGGWRWEPVDPDAAVHDES